MSFGVASLAAVLSFLSPLEAADPVAPPRQPVIFSSSGVANAAGYTAGRVSPGELIAVFGRDLGPAELTTLEVVNGFLTTELSGVRVLFDGVAAPLIYVSAGQVSAVVPYGVAAKTATKLTVDNNGSVSDAITLPVEASVPGIFTVPGTVINGAYYTDGQAAALNQDGTLNSRSNAAQPGEIVSLFVTGEGLTEPGGQDGWIVDPNVSLPKPKADVHVRFKSEAEVLYAGAAPYLVSGVMQVNARIPLDNGTAVQTPVTVSVGDTVSQDLVRVAVIVQYKPLASGRSTMLLGDTESDSWAGVDSTPLVERVLPFEVKGASGAVVMSGLFSDSSLTLSPSGNVWFRPRLLNLDDHGSGAKVVRVSQSGFAGFEVAVEYLMASLGDVGPRTASRSENGDVVTFEFAPPVGPGVATYPMGIRPNAKETDQESVVTIEVELPDSSRRVGTVAGAQGPQ
ncbi:MAG: IPT/TIG domain-containing protein [Bryobacterales bacterium]|nr:IPT/TIG domain-containing protein [Bryobacterales bacterium]